MSETKKQKKFEEKVRSMTAKEIIMAMVDGLKNPAVAVDMMTFGFVRGGVCYGCAATNTICQIAGIKLTPNNINFAGRSEAANADINFIDKFEEAVDDLRRGDVDDYNVVAQKIGISTISIPADFYLPILYTENYQERLHKYEELANLQE